MNHQLNETVTLSMEDQLNALEIESQNTTTQLDAIETAIVQHRLTLTSTTPVPSAETKATTLRNLILLFAMNVILPKQKVLFLLYPKCVTANTVSDLREL